MHVLSTFLDMYLGVMNVSNFLKHYYHGFLVV